MIGKCNRCLLTSEVPGVTITGNGLCSVCKQHDMVYSDWYKNKEKYQKKIEKIFDKIRKKNRVYDVLVPFSGGKDSTYVLYLCKKKFNLKCLAVTYDNGFLSDHARKNIQNACDKLGVDHLYYGMSKPVLMELYRYFFLKSGFFCPVCMRGIQVAISRTQLAFNIPLALRGTCHRTEEYIAPQFFLPGYLHFLENVLKGSPLEKKAEPLLTPVGLFSSPPQIRLPDYVEWDYDVIFKTISEEIGWKAKKAESEHADCKVHEFINYTRLKKFPVLKPELLRYSKLVTVGVLSREEALKKIGGNNKKIEEPANMNWVLSTLGITKEQVNEVLADPLRHMNFLKSNNKIVRRLKALTK